MIVTNRMRGLLAGVDERTLREKIAREPGKGLFEKLTANFRETSAMMREKGDRFVIGQCACWYVTPQEMEAGFIHRMSGDGEALEYVHRMIDVLEREWITDIKPYHKRAGGGNTNYFSQAKVCLAADMCRESLDPRRFETLLGMVRDFFINDDHFSDGTFGHWSGHNIGFTTQISSAICALVLGKESGHPEWERYVDLGRDMCLQYARWGLDRHGYSYEGTGYGSIPIHYIYLYAYLLLQNGRENLFATLPALREIPEATFQMLFPDCSNVAQISDLNTPAELPWLLLTAKQFNRPQDLDLWYRYKQTGEHSTKHVYRGSLLSLLWLDDTMPRQAVETVSLPTASCAHGTETVNFRTSWDADAVYVNLLGQGRSVSSLGHMHADCGHFSLVAHGEYLAIDGGYWTEFEDHHNVVMIDGKNRRAEQNPLTTTFRVGRVADFQRHALLDYAQVDGSHVKDCRWAHRHALFVRLGGDDAYFVTLDNINPDDSFHTFWWQLHVHPQSEIVIGGPASASVRRSQARLDLTFLNPSAEDYPTHPHTLSLRTDEVYAAHEAVTNRAMDTEEKRAQARERSRQITGNDLGICSEWNQRLIAEQQGLNCMLMAVISPRRIDQPPLQVRQTMYKHILRAEIDCGDFTDTIVSALDHAYIRLPDMEGHTELALIRRDRQGRVLGQWTVDGGSLLLR